MKIYCRDPAIEEQLIRESFIESARKLQERVARLPFQHGERHVDPVRRERSLRCCHLPSYERPLLPVRETGAFVPEMSARIDDDPNLTDGARRCARKIAEYTYRHFREDRCSRITVTWLMKALGKCRRTVQRYLRLLERCGYIRVSVVASQCTRMAVGLAVDLLSPLLPRHCGWSGKSMKPGATFLSHNKTRNIIPRHLWALRCMDGVFRALVKTLPPAPWMGLEGPAGCMGCPSPAENGGLSAAF